MEVGYLVLSIASSEFNSDYEAAKNKLVLLNVAGFVTRTTGEQIIKNHSFPNVTIRWEKLSTF